MGNIMLEYYEKYNISPEHHAIDDINIHFEKRSKLYRQCGISQMAFRNAEMLEVGPGSGYNTLAFFSWGCKHIDLVEANPQGIKDMRMLFKEQKITENKYDMFQSKIEDFKTDRKYDIIIAEGIIPYVENKYEILNILVSMMNKNGIIVITCAEKTAYFIEIIKKLIGIALSKDISEYTERVKYLTDIFKPQLAKLRGTSKLPEEWVKDIILNPVISSGLELTFAQAIQYAKNDFEILGTSPSMFTDYSWNKDIWYDYKKDYLEQYRTKRLSLLMANMPEIILPAEQADFLVKCFEGIYDAEMEYEKTLKTEKIQHIINIMTSMESILTQSFNKEFLDVFFEIKEALISLSGGYFNIKNYPHFFAAFGRTQQYISFIKK